VAARFDVIAVLDSELLREKKDFSWRRWDRRFRGIVSLMAHKPTKVEIGVLLYSSSGSFARQSAVLFLPVGAVMKVRVGCNATLFSQGTLFSLIIPVILVLGGCGGGGVTPVKPNPTPTVSSISVTASATSLNVGQTQQLSVNEKLSDGSTRDGSGVASWSSANASVATVSASGLVTAMSPGMVTLSATVSGIVGSISLTVSPSLKSISVTPAAPTLQVGASQQFTATANYSDGSTKDVTSSSVWASSNKPVATISATGVATTIAPGTTSVSASFSGLTGSAILTVDSSLKSISVTPAAPTLQVGASQQFTATANYSDGSTKDVTSSSVWASSNVAIITFSTYGLATRVAPGAATLSATFQGLSGSVSVAGGSALKSIAITPVNPSILLDSYQQFTATANYADGSSYDVTPDSKWVSSAQNIAFDPNVGMVFARSVGTTSISATYSGMSGSTILTVTPTLKSILVAPATASILTGQTQQFTATGTYSDGSMKDVSGVAVWSSYPDPVASVTSTGLTTGLYPGTTAISATITAPDFSRVVGAASLTVTPTLESIGVTVTGLVGSGLVLQLNSSSSLAITANGNALFSTKVASGAGYVVTVLTQPTSPSQVCRIANGSGSVGNTDVTNVVVDCAPDLKTMSTITELDAALPQQLSQSINQIISSADSQSLGSLLEIPTNSAGFATPIFAVDIDQGVLLAAFADSATTKLSADSTAEVLVVSTIGSIPSTGPAFSELLSDVHGTAGYSELVSDISQSITSGTPPLKSNSVVVSVATVVNQTIALILARGPQSNVSTKSTLIASEPFAEEAVPPPPIQIVGPTGNATFESVFISAATASGGVTLVNNMPISWEATSADENSSPIDTGKPLPGVGFFTTAIPVDIAGNGDSFTVTVAQTEATEQANLKKLVSDYVSLSLEQITGLGPEGLGPCAQEVSDSILKALGDTFQKALLDAPTGTAASLLLAGNLTGTTIFNALKYALNCAIPAGNSAPGVLKALANLSSWVAPTLQLWKALSLVTGPATDSGFTWYYWDQSQSIRVCESEGKIAPCGDFWEGTYQITSCSAPGAIGTGGATAYCDMTMNWPNGALYDSGYISFRSGSSESFNFRRDYSVGGSISWGICKADSIPVKADTTNFTESTFAEASYGTPGLFDPNTVTYTITTHTVDEISGTFTAPVPYLIAQTGASSDWTKGSLSGTWQVHPVPTPFPKCVPPSPTNLYCSSSGTGYDPTTLADIPCGQPFLSVDSPPRPGEWHGLP
jgi:trimeric autotransporter adhesin